MRMMIRDRCAHVLGCLGPQIEFRVDIFEVRIVFPTPRKCFPIYTKRGADLAVAGSCSGAAMFITSSECDCLCTVLPHPPNHPPVRVRPRSCSIDECLSADRRKSVWVVCSGGHRAGKWRELWPFRAECQTSSGAARENPSSFLARFSRCSQ